MKDGAKSEPKEVDPRQEPRMIKAIVSLCLSFISVFLVWLILPVFVLPPIAALLGGMFFWQSNCRRGYTFLLCKLVHLVPLAVAVSVFIWGMWLIETGYRA